MNKGIIILALFLIASITPSLQTPQDTQEDNHVARYILVLKGVPIKIEKPKVYSEETLAKYRLEIYHELKRAYTPQILKLESKLSELGGKILRVIYSAGIAEIEIPKEKLEILLNEPYIEEVTPTFKLKVQMDIAAPSVYAPTLWEHGLIGADNINDKIKGVEVAVVDTGVYNSSYLGSRLIDQESFVLESPEDNNGHGTRVANIIASSHPTYRGIAYGANIINAKALYANGTGSPMDVMRAIEWAITNAKDPAEIINLSLGAPEDKLSGLYADGSSILTRFIDRLAAIYDVLFLIAIGNVEGGYEGVNIPGDNYNGITVGGISDKGTTSRSDDTFWSGSCHGPTRDGRLKPEVVAPAEDITTLGPGDTTVTGSGTSFATPIVAGGAADAWGYLVSRGVLAGGLHLGVKAAIINSADVWGGGINNYYGFGYVNYSKLYESLNFTRVINITSGNIFSYVFDAQAGREISITLTWDRVPVLGDSYAFYDLGKFSVKLEDPDGDIVYSRITDGNNTLKIVFTPESSGKYRLLIEKLFGESEPIKELLGIASTVRLMEENLSVGITGVVSYFDNESSNIAIRIRYSGYESPVDVRVEISGDIIQNTTINLTLNSGDTKTYPLNASWTGTGVSQITIRAFIGSEKILENGSYIFVMDDDVDKPNIKAVAVSLDSIANKIKISVVADDASGISRVVFYWRLKYVLSSEYLEDADGYVVLELSNGVWYGELDFPEEWSGQKLYYVIAVYDNDTDWPGDSSVSYYEGEVEIRSYKTAITVLIALIALAVIIVVIRRYGRKFLVSLKNLRGGESG